MIYAARTGDRPKMEPTSALATGRCNSDSMNGISPDLAISNAFSGLYLSCDGGYS